MKLSEAQQAQVDANRDAKAVLHARCAVVLASIEGRDIPIYSEGEATPRGKKRRGSRHHLVRDAMRLALRSPGPYQSFGFADVACEHCGTEMLDTDPGTALKPGIFKKRVGCPGCGALTYLSPPSDKGTPA